MKPKKLTTLIASLTFTLSSYSKVDPQKHFPEDRVIIKGEYLILADEPGLINCPNLNCDIPVDLKTFRKEESKYIPISSITSSKLNSNSHTLYQHKDKIIDSYSTRNQTGPKSIILKTHLKSFDYSNPENPISLTSQSFGGELIASDLNDNMLTNLSTEIINSTSPLSTVFEECDNFHSMSKANVDNSEFLLLRLINTPLENINKSLQSCLIIDTTGIKNSNIKSKKDSIYITFSDNNLQRHIIRYKYEQGNYSFDNSITLDEDRYSKNLGNYIQESSDILMIAGDYKFEENTQAGIKIFNIKNNAIVLNSEKNISLTPYTHTRSSLKTLSKVIDNHWYIAVNSNTSSSTNNLFNVDISTPTTPEVSSIISIPGDIERITPIFNNLLSIYTRQFVFPPTTSLSIVDTSNALRSHLVYSELLTQGFSHQPLAIENVLTQSSYFKNQYSGKLITPLENTQDSPLSIETSLAGSNSGKDVPSKRKVDLIAIDLFKYDNCISLSKSCWIAEKFQTNTLILPYEGDEPSRARSFIDKTGYYYVLGDDIQFFPYQ